MNFAASPLAICEVGLNSVDELYLVSHWPWSHETNSSSLIADTGHVKKIVNTVNAKKESNDLMNVKNKKKVLVSVSNSSKAKVPSAPHIHL